MADARWEFPDAWVMISAAGCGRRGCDLSRLIGTADACNHDIPTEDVIERSIGRLVASGLMTASHDLRVRLTREGRKTARMANGGMFERAPHLLDLLQAHPLTEGHWPLPPGAWQTAYDAYVRRMA